MNKKMVLIIIGIVLIIVGIIVLLIVFNTPNEIEITRNETRGIPYKYEYEIEDESIVKLVKSYNLDKDDKRKGGTDRINYVFTGLKKGTTKVIFKKIDLYSGEIATQETITFKVDARKNISLLAVPKE